MNIKEADMSSALKTPFTNIQQELLQLYTREVSEEDLKNIKELIGKYFAQRLTNLADDAWDNNGWTQQDMEDILNDPNQ
ncbi:hypothetical protein [Dyadobacter sp. CY356]|uniref:hypothetical protein n=1 Tax=Dyadobacter sp. CY356 TaxID=2906442 RepID=UPI001F39A389|nr:hypothetical protein [Dyadobacter sp. CY356]MCF0058423.1 hypothetical protein [Dyadobacter sp. CY356]